MFSKKESKKTVMGVRVTPEIQEEFKVVCKERKVSISEAIEFLMKDFNKEDFLKSRGLK